MSISIYLNNNQNYGISLYKAIKSKKINISPCNLSHFLEDANTLSKTSTSQSIIIDGKIKNINKNVIIKLSFHETGVINTMAYEIEIYKYIINELIINKYTPHLISFIGAYTCVDFLNNIYSFLDKKDFQDFFKEIIKQSKHIQKTYESDYFKTKNITYDFKTVNLLLLEKSKGIMFEEWISNGKKTIQDWSNVLFQIFYTLYIFSILGIRHNDLHFKNILIEKCYQKELIYIISNDKYIKLKTNYFVKIFDFDQSSINYEKIKLFFDNVKNSKELKKGNMLLEHVLCEPFGICKDYNPKFDEYMVFLQLIYSAVELTGNQRIEEAQFLKKLIFEFVSDDLLLQEFPKPGRLCKVQNKKCNGTFIPSDKDLKPLKKVLYYFQDNIVPTYKLTSNIFNNSNVYSFYKSST